MNVINLNGLNIDQLRNEAEMNGEVLEAVRKDRGPNARADLIMDEVERLGAEVIPPVSPEGWAAFDQAASLFHFFYLRLTGQDKILPVRDAWVMHEDQRGAVVLHPTARGRDYIEGKFIDPNGSGTWKVTIERDEPCCEGVGE